MTTEGQRLIEGNQMLSFYLLRTHFLYEKKNCAITTSAV